MNLGTKPKTEGPTLAGTEKPKTRYPSFEIRDAKMEEFLGAHPKDFNDTFTAKVKLRVSRLNRSEYGKEIGFEVVELHPDKDLYSKLPGDAVKYKKLFA